MNDCLAAALTYAARGWAVFPVAGKVPLTEHGFKDASTDSEQLAELFSENGTRAGVAIRTGEVSGLVVLDVDTPKGGAGTLAQLEKQHGKLPPTFEVLTGGGGRHYFFRHPGQPVRNSASAVLGHGLDVRADGGYVVAPPSPHESGRAYKLLHDRDPAELPSWLLARLTDARLVPAGPVGESIPEGARNVTLASLAGTMRRRGASENEIRAALDVANRERCSPPLDDDEVARIAESVSRYPAAAPPRPGPPPTVPQGEDPERASEAARSHSWTPIDLVALELDPPPPPTTLGLIYPGRRHVFSGEPETLKTWAALIACATEILAGRTVVYIDLENGAATMLDRLRALGLDDEAIRQRFLYLTPEEPMTEATVLADIEALLAKERPALAVFDSFTGALALHGLDPNSGVDVERFYRTVVGPLQASGAAVVLLDHLTKDREKRGKFSIGSERKLGGADVHLGFEVVRPFGRGKTGLAKIVTHKDRPGHLPRPKAAELELASDPETGAVTWTVRPAENPDEEHPFRPTRLMEKVSRYVAAHVAEERPSRNAVEEIVTGKRDYIRLAIDLLVAEGFLKEDRGPRGARQLQFVKPYAEADDALS